MAAARKIRSADKRIRSFSKAFWIMEIKVNVLRLRILVYASYCEIQFVTEKINNIVTNFLHK